MTEVQKIEQTRPPEPAAIEGYTWKFSTTTNKWRKNKIVSETQKAATLQKRRETMAKNAVNRPTKQTVGIQNQKLEQVITDSVEKTNLHTKSIKDQIDELKGTIESIKMHFIPRAQSPKQPVVEQTVQKEIEKPVSVKQIVERPKSVEQILGIEPPVKQPEKIPNRNPNLRKYGL